MPNEFDFQEDGAGQGVDTLDFQPEASAGEMARHVIGTLGRAAADTVAAVPDFIATMAERTDAHLAPDNPLRSQPPGTPRSQYGTGRVAAAIRDAANNVLPAPDPRLSDSFWLTDIPSALGTVGAMVAGGGVAGGAARLGGLEAAGAAVAAGTGMGFAAEFEDAFDRASRLGQSPDEALARSLGYATVAALIENRLGAGRILRRYFPSAEKAFSTLTAKGVATNVAKDLVAGFAEEATQRLAQNAIVAGEFNTTGAFREGAAGAVVEAALGLPGSWVHRHRASRPEALPEPLPATPSPFAQSMDDFRMDVPAEPQTSAVDSDIRFQPADVVADPAEAAATPPGPDAQTGSMGIPMDPGATATPVSTATPQEGGTLEDVTPPADPPSRAPAPLSETEPSVGAAPVSELPTPVAPEPTGELAPVEEWAPVIAAAKGRQVQVQVDTGLGESQTVKMSAPRAIKRQRSLIDVLDQIRDCLTR